MINDLINNDNICKNRSFNNEHRWNANKYQEAVLNKNNEELRTQQIITNLYYMAYQNKNKNLIERLFINCNKET